LPSHSQYPAIQAVQNVANAAVITVPTQKDPGSNLAIDFVKSLLPGAVGATVTPEAIDAAAKVIDQTFQQAAENDNHRDLDSDDPVEQAFNGLVAAGKIPLETIQAIGNHATAVVDASQQFAQNPIGTLGYGAMGTIDSVGKAALDTAEGWAWVAQNPGTAWETTKLVGGDVLRNLEDQMHRDPSGFAMQTVINLGTLLSPTSRAGTSFTLTPLKTANTAENIVTTAVPIIDGANVPRVLQQL
jgi:hypothetical protein